MARITVRVHARADHTGIAGRLGDAYKLNLAAPPLEGRANEECIRFLAELAGVPRSSVRILLGLTSRTKVVQIDGISQPELEGKLSA